SFSLNHDHVDRTVLDDKGQNVNFDPSMYWMNNKIFTFVNENLYLQSRLVMEKTYSHLNAFRFGGEYDYAHTDGRYNDRDILFKDHYGAVFAENDLYFTSDFI